MGFMKQDILSGLKKNNSSNHRMQYWKGIQGTCLMHQLVNEITSQRAAGKGLWLVISHVGQIASSCESLQVLATFIDETHQTLQQSSGSGFQE